MSQRNHEEEEEPKAREDQATILLRWLLGILGPLGLLILGFWINGLRAELDSLRSLGADNRTHIAVLDARIEAINEKLARLH